MHILLMIVDIDSQYFLSSFKPSDYNTDGVSIDDSDCNCLWSIRVCTTNLHHPISEDVQICAGLGHICVVVLC